MTKLVYYNQFQLSYFQILVNFDDFLIYTGLELAKQLAMLQVPFGQTLSVIGGQIENPII